MPIDSGNLALKGLDELFSTEEKRQEEQSEQVHIQGGHFGGRLFCCTDKSLLGVA